MIQGAVECDALVVVEWTHCPFVLDGAGRVGMANPGGAGFVVDTVATFVAERPDNHAGVVFVPSHHVADPFEVGGTDPRFLAETQ